MAELGVKTCRKLSKLNKKLKAAQSTFASPTTSAPTPPSTQAPANTQSEQLRGTTVKMSRLRQVIARRMIESIQTSN